MAEGRGILMSWPISVSASSRAAVDVPQVQGEGAPSAPSWPLAWGAGGIECAPWFLKELMETDITWQVFWRGNFIFFIHA